MTLSPASAEAYVSAFFANSDMADSFEFAILDSAMVPGGSSDKYGDDDVCEVECFQTFNGELSTFTFSVWFEPLIGELYGEY